MLKAVTRSWEILTPKQRQIMELSQAGATQEQIAIRLGVNKSTDSRTLGRAKRSMREEAERSLQEQKLDARHLDMADPATAKVILSAMTPKQAVYLYLYYSEWLSLREISELTKTDHSTIYRTICRALRNIGSVLGYQETVLENMDSLDDLAYQLYSEIQDQDDIVPPEMYGLGLGNRPTGRMRVGFRRGRRSCRRSASGHQPAGYELVRMGLGHSGGKRQRGRLFGGAAGPHPGAGVQPNDYGVAAGGIPPGHGETRKERETLVAENIFPRRLQELRERRHISRMTLGQLCGLSKNMIAMYERGEKAPSVYALIRIADYFGVSVDYLLGREKNF